MQPSEKHNQRIAEMTFASVYPHYVTKVEKKGRTETELQQVITWLTGYSADEQQNLIDEKVTFQEFFDEASLNPDSDRVRGVICGYRIEEIENPLTRDVRKLDKLVDDLAKGRKLTYIFGEG